MSRINNHGNDVLRRFIQQAESYNRCMFTKKNENSVKNQRSNDRITEQILFCQNQIENLNILTKTRNIIDTKCSNEILMVDIVSDKYQYSRSSLELNVIQQCSVVSIISPHAFTVQLTKDLNEFEEFFKSMNDYYNLIDDLHISKEYLRSNLLCVTWDETSSTWNRSQILEYDLVDDTVNVFFVDLNSWEEHVSHLRIRFILTKYSIRPVHVLTCRLASITSIEMNHQWNDVVLKTFQNVIENCQCDIEPLYQDSNQIYYVNLFAQHQEAYVCINDFLIHCQMAKPFDDISNENILISMKDSNGQLMHPMIALYWKAGETMTSMKKEIDEQHLSTSNEPFESLSITKTIQINEDEKIIFAKYKNYIMLPWFTISNILKEFNEENIQKIANKFGFKPVIIDPLTHPILCSQLIKFLSRTKLTNEIHLYSIDCVRKIFQMYDYYRTDIYQLLDRARLAETNNDRTFWLNSFEYIQ